MKLLHFVDAAGTDEHYVPAKNVNLIETINAANLKVWFSNSDSNVSDHNVQVGVTAGEADEFLLAISEHLIDTGIHSHGILTIKASTYITNSYGFDGVGIANVASATGSGIKTVLPA